MALTKEQFLELRQKGLTVEQITKFEAGETPAQAAQSTSAEPQFRESKPIRDTFTGLAKSLGSTFMGIGELGRGVQKRALPFTVGDEPSLFDKGSAQNTNAQEALKADSKAERTSKFVGDVAQFAIPTTAATKATKGLGIVRQILTRGATGATTMAAQEGEFNKEAGIAGAVEAASGPIGMTFSKLTSTISKDLPTWLVKPLLKQSKDAKAKGRDITEFLVDSGRVGSVDDLISKSQTAIDDLGKQVDDILKQGSDEGITVTREQIAQKVAQGLNDAGAAVDEAEILDIVGRLSPQAKGLLQKETLTLAEANKLRSSIDRTLGDRGFLRDQLPFNKEVLRNFTNTLRNTVKTEGDDALTPLFDDYAKNIRLRDALIDQASSGVAKNSLGFYDLLTGVGAFGATGNPLTAGAAVAGRRLFESAQFKTGAAQILRNTESVQQALSKYAPEQRAVILQFINALGENNSTQEQSTPTQQ